MNNLDRITNDLSKNWTAAQNQWAETASKWRDNKGRAFRQRYWTTLESNVPGYLEALQEIIGAVQESQRRIPE